MHTIQMPKHKLCTWSKFGVTIWEGDELDPGQSGHCTSPSCIQEFMFFCTIVLVVCLTWTRVHFSQPYHILDRCILQNQFDYLKVMGTF